MTTPTLPAEKVLKGSRAYWSLLAQATAVSKLNSHVQLYFCLHHNTENTSKPCPQRVEYYSRFPTQNHLYFFFSSWYSFSRDKFLLSWSLVEISSQFLQWLHFLFSWLFIDILRLIKPGLLSFLFFLYIFPKDKVYNKF